MAKMKKQNNHEESARQSKQQTAPGSETQPNLSAELKKGHFWIECYDQGAEKEFW